VLFLAFCINDLRIFYALFRQCLKITILLEKGVASIKLT